MAGTRPGPGFRCLAPFSSDDHEPRRAKHCPRVEVWITHDPSPTTRCDGFWLRQLASETARRLNHRVQDQWRAATAWTGPAAAGESRRRPCLFRLYLASTVFGQTSNAGFLFGGGWGSGFNFSTRFILPVFSSALHQAVCPASINTAEDTERELMN